MHVGHLRSTVIGDALARTLRFFGHEVVARNHVGDWGTPFGMLIEHLLDLGEDAAAEELSVGDLDEFYKAAREKFDADAAFAERSRSACRRPAGAATPRRCGCGGSSSTSRSHYFDARLRHARRDAHRRRRGGGVAATTRCSTGVVDDLDAAGLLVESDGAQCVFPPGFTNREGEPLPLIVRKRDGGYGYAATDLAAIRDRVGTLGCDRSLLRGRRAAVPAPRDGLRRGARGRAGSPSTSSSTTSRSATCSGPDHKMLRSRTGESVKLRRPPRRGGRRARTRRSRRATPTTATTSGRCWPSDRRSAR